MSKEHRGEQAAHLLDNQLFREIIAELELTYLDRWKNAKTIEAREDLHRYITVLRQIPNDLRSIATTGQLERARIKELEADKRVIRWPTI